MAQFKARYRKTSR